jgi:hypothetical protein
MPQDTSSPISNYPSSPFLAMSQNTSSLVSEHSSPPIQDQSRSSSVSPTPESIEHRPVNLTQKEDKLLEHLLKQMKKFAPHMRNSFIWNKAWWENNSQSCSLHVHFVSLNEFRTTSDTEFVVDVQVCHLPSPPNHCGPILRPGSSDTETVPGSYGRIQPEGQTGVGK